MAQFTVHAAKTHLSKLIEATLAGDEVVITKGDRPVVRLIPIPQGAFKIGFLKDKLPGNGPDFLEPLDESVLDMWEGRS